jgi:hypothetical protein
MGSLLVELLPFAAGLAVTKAAITKHQRRRTPATTAPGGR